MLELPLHPATRIGTFAADILKAGGEADVIAVFERSFYLLCGKGIVAVCLDDLGAGPINVLVPPRGAEPPWQGLVRDGMKAKIASGRITVHGGFICDVASAEEWSPPAWGPWPSNINGTLESVHAHLAAHLGQSSSRADQGLAPLIFTPNAPAAKTSTAFAARDLVRDLRAALPKALQSQAWPDDARRAATLLVGLGPGLTPSGDDLLGGLFLALTARGEHALRDALFDLIVDELGDLTVPVSAMHLTAAAHGQGHEAMHALLNCILQSDAAALPAHLDAVARIGATSGLDAIAGAVMGLSG